jgi:hypothetical protein
MTNGSRSATLVCTLECIDRIWASLLDSEPDTTAVKFIFV